MAIFSDIHGNFDALRVVSQELAEDDFLIVLGDVVGYGAEPELCVQWVKERKAQVILGNHEACLLGKMPLSWFNPAAAQAIMWTKEHLSGGSLSFLEGLPSFLTFPDYLCVHGSPREPTEEYIVDPWQAREIFEERKDFSLCFFGHTHVAEGYLWGKNRVGRVSFLKGGVISLEPGFRYLINCGSVGQPRDGNPQASFGFFFVEERRIEIRRIEYDVEAAMQKILDARLPEVLAYRLGVGR